jgi:hypothetical protein
MNTNDSQMADNKHADKRVHKKASLRLFLKLCVFDNLLTIYQLQKIDAWQVVGREHIVQAAYRTWFIVHSSMYSYHAASLPGPGTIHWHGVVY